MKLYITGGDIDKIINKITVQKILKVVFRSIKVNLHGIASKNQAISSNAEQSDLHLTTLIFILDINNVRRVNM